EARTMSAVEVDGVLGRSQEVAIAEPDVRETIMSPGRTAMLQTARLVEVISEDAVIDQNIAHPFESQSAAWTFDAYTRKIDDGLAFAVKYQVAEQKITGWLFVLLPESLVSVLVTIEVAHGSIVRNIVHCLGTVGQITVPRDEGFARFRSKQMDI